MERPEHHAVHTSVIRDVPQYNQYDVHVVVAAFAVVLRRMLPNVELATPAFEPALRAEYPTDFALEIHTQWWLLALTTPPQTESLSVARRQRMDAGAAMIAGAIQKSVLNRLSELRERTSEAYAEQLRVVETKLQDRFVPSAAPGHIVV